MPVWAMCPYAQGVFDALKPSRYVYVPYLVHGKANDYISVALLDTYAVPAYISANPIAFHEAPIRYLRTKGNLSQVCLYRRIMKQYKI